MAKRKKAMPWGSRIIGTETALARFVKVMAAWKYPSKGTVGVYAILNVIGGRAYIGSAAKDMAGRWRTHLKQLRGGRHPNTGKKGAFRSPEFRARVSATLKAYHAAKREVGDA